MYSTTQVLLLTSRLLICVFSTFGLSLILYIRLVYLILLKLTILMFFLSPKFGSLSILPLAAQLFDAIPRGFFFISTSRPVSGSSLGSIVSGGTGFLVREPCNLYLHLLLLSNLLNSQLSQSSFLAQTLLSIVSIGLLILLLNFEILNLSLSSSKI
jgi:hypothetical protein